VLNEAQLERYSRQLVLPEWSEVAQVRLQRASVLVVGAGALGAPVAYYLAAAGVGRLGILDDDEVEISNLHRQLLHFTPDVGVGKAESAAAKLAFLNPEIVVDPYPARFEADNGALLVAGHDLVVDCSDSFETRYAVNRACVEAGVPLVEGGAVGFSGIVMTIVPRLTACYRCAFPSAPADGGATCAAAGILGPASGVVGSFMALEALRQVGGIGPSLVNAFLQCDLHGLQFTRVNVTRDPACADCGAG
jgi:molybdopterin/thiamine biosynthesis adenylyltransferase